MDRPVSPQPSSPGPPKLHSLGPHKPRANSLAPNNDWAYQDRGLPPEKEPTKERASRDQSAAATPVSGVSDDEEYALEDVKPNVYQTTAGRRRAKVPDKEDGSVEPTGVQSNGNASNQQQNGAPTGRRPSRWEDFKAAAIGSAAASVAEETKLRYVTLHWEKKKIQGLEKIVLNARVPQRVVKSQVESQNYVSWQHCRRDSLTLKKLEDLVNEAKAQGVQESEFGLTLRLLKRVRLESERPFVGGSFLTPRALRYDSLDSSRYSADKCCIFVAFPYFAVGNAPPKASFVNLGKEHPTRTLLQSIYRLNNTLERDQIQCIRMLTRKELRSCIEAEESDLSKISRKVKEELIYVPQLWALILGLDRLVTLGSISDRSLQGRGIEVKEEQNPVNRKRCSLVRIRFKNQRRVEDLTYPIEQCTSWFGLVNKQQQLRKVLTKEKESSDPRKYKLLINGRVIEASTWASIQRSAESEVLDLWMETPKEKSKEKPKQDLPQFSIESPKVDETLGKGTERIEPVKRLVDTASAPPSPSQAPAKDSGDQDQDDDGITATAVGAGLIKFDKLEEVPIILPFFQWRIIDESGEKVDCEPLERVDRFIDLIYRNLPAAVADTTGAFINPNASNPKRSTAQRVLTTKKITIKARTSDDLVDELLHIFANRTDEDAQIARGLHAICSRTLTCFLPNDYDPERAPVKLFWGALYEIISRASHSYLVDLQDKMYILHAWVERIHLGVHYRRTELAPGGREVEHDDISESAILLSSMVDAFGALLNMLVAAVSDVMGDTKQSNCGRKVLKSFNEARELLETARDELIVEASGVAPGEHIDPVLTPEAILIMHMERLVSGVYKGGNVNIVNILEECLERLAMQVRYRYSRRLLQMINAFEEEVAVVHEVLRQQRRVLGEFRGYLKPSSFDTPSTARKMRFEFEEKGIERVLVTLREQLKNCTELQERAKVLAVQNVHLVETLQDDNGRAIFIFTFITVLFLPLSFVAGFFGMNLQGISGTSYKATLFWKIAVPVTGFIVLVCFAVIIWGERVWFGIASIPRACSKMYRKKVLRS